MVKGFKEQLNRWGAGRTPFVFLIDFECLHPKCWALSQPIDEFKYDFQGFTNFEKNIASRKSLSSNLIVNKKPIPFSEYKRKFDIVKKEIEYGNSFLVNLTNETKIDTGLSLEEIAQQVSSKYVCWLKNEFVCFSPETFIQIKNHTISSFPMKGTIDGSLNNAKEIILNDPKEKAEHATIVDLIRNDLSRVASNVHVSTYRYYEEISTRQGLLGQVSSIVEGKLPADYHKKIGDLLFTLLPAGSISGAPKNKTQEIIKRAEKNERGYYTGVAGYFDGESLDSCVLIRYLQANNQYRSGGGITAQSDAEKEYHEMIKKIYVPIF